MKVTFSSLSKMCILTFVSISSITSYAASSTKQNCDRKKFPNSWYESVDPKTAPSWEILPQEAKNCEVILSKRNELGILSNFAHTPFLFQGIRYKSLEGFWQMMKFPENKMDERNKIPSSEWVHSRKEVSQMIGFKAKRAGSLGSKAMKKLKIDWVSYSNEHFIYRSKKKGKHYKLILAAMKAKLEQNPKVKAILLKTDDLTLKPDHHQSKDAPPAWRYYQIWMELRANLKE